MRRIGLSLVTCAGLLAVSPGWGQTMGPSDGTPLSALQQSLHLTAQQQPAWKAYRDAGAGNQQAQGRRLAAARMFPKLTSPQRMDLVEAEMRQELADLERQSHALKAFYATLTPEQKRTFDAQTLPPQGQGQGQGQGQ